MDNAVTELAAYFRARTPVPDDELIRLTSSARAGGHSWTATAAACGISTSQDTDGIVSLPSGRIPRTGAELLYRATQGAVERVTGSRRYPPLTWPCASCRRQITDRAGAGRPIHVEHGRAAGCTRLVRDQAADAAARRARLPALITVSEPAIGPVQRHHLAQPLIDDCPRCGWQGYFHEYLATIDGDWGNAVCDNCYADLHPATSCWRAHLSSRTRRSAWKPTTMWRGEESGSPVELLQAKHHVGVSTGLGDKDTDIWKTLLVWMNTAQPADPQGPALVLVTTSVAQPGTAAHALRRDVRDTLTAVIKLMEAARSSSAENTRKARERFLALTDAERQIFLARVVVADGAPTADDLDEKLARVLWHALPHINQDLFLSMVWRWWAAVALDMLRGRRAVISVGEAHAAISHLRDQFAEDNLPTTVELADVDESYVIAAHGEAPSGSLSPPPPCSPPPQSPVRLRRKHEGACAGQALPRLR